MKYLELTLVILAAVFIYQIEAIRKPSDTLNYLEETVNGTVEFLSDYEYQLAVDGDEQFRDLFDREEEAISKNTNDSLQLIQKKIQEADIEDSLARKCNRSAVLGFSRAERKIMSILGRCFANNYPNFYYFHERIEVNIETGKELLNQFTRIREDCISKLVNEELCIARQLPGATGLAALYEVNVAKLRAEVALTSSEGFKHIASCSESPLDSFKIEVQDMVSTAEKCIKSA